MRESVRPLGDVRVPSGSGARRALSLSLSLPAPRVIYGSRQFIGAVEWGSGPNRICAAMRLCQA